MKRFGFSPLSPTLLAGLLFISLVQGLRGIWAYAYVGQDFATHVEMVESYGQGFTYRQTNPPGLYALSYLVRRTISDVFVLEFTAVALLLSNLIALVVFYILIHNIIRNTAIRWALLLLFTFVPFRVIHSVVLASDALTLLPFFLIVLVSSSLIKIPAPRYRMGLWFLLTGLLLVGLYVKFTFVALLPAVALLAVFYWKRLPSAERTIGAFWPILVCLAVPASYFAYQMDQSAKAKSWTTELHWRAPDAPPSMRLQDMITLKSRDLELFDAPYIFDGQLLERQRYSYLGLLHLASFSDSHNLFQELPADWSTDPKARVQGFRHRIRSEQAHFWTRIAVVAALPLTILTLVGALIYLPRCAVSLWTGRARALPLPLLAFASLGFAFYAMIVLPLPFVARAYEWGYWLPRLVLPGLAAFFTIGFFMLDGMARRWPWVAPAVLGYCAFLSALFIYIL